MLWWKNKKQKQRQPNLMEGQNGYVFRRSRTLTGSTSEKLTPAAEKTNQLKTERLKSHERRAKLKGLMRLGLVWLAIVVILGFLAAMYIKSPNVAFLPVNNNKKADVSLYKKVINEYLNKNPAQHFSFTVVQDGLEAYVKSQRPEVDRVVISRSWFGGDLKFSIVFRKPLIVWKVGEQNFYVDSQGEAFSYNHFDEPKLVVTDQSGIKPDESGGAVASSRFIKFLGQLIGAVEGYGLGKVNEVIIPPSTREIQLKLEGRDYVIKTHSDRDPMGQAEDIKNALKYFDEKGIQPQYVDVRVANKAYYK